MQRKRVLAILLTAVIAFCCGVFALAVVLRPQVLSIGTVDLSSAADGHYIGVCQNKILFAVVDVTVSEHRLVRAEVLWHKESYMPQARYIVQQAVEKQSLQIDALSGATLTSTTVLKAMENALSQAI